MVSNFRELLAQYGSAILSLLLTELQTSIIEGAEALKGKREWLSTLGTKAEVLEETYGVLVHGVPVNRVNVNNQAQIIEQIKMWRDFCYWVLGWLSATLACCAGR